MSSSFSVLSTILYVVSLLPPTRYISICTRNFYTPHPSSIPTPSLWFCYLPPCSFSIPDDPLNCDTLLEIMATCVVTETIWSGRSCLTNPFFPIGPPSLPPTTTSSQLVDELTAFYLKTIKSFLQ